MRFKLFLFALFMGCSAAVLSQTGAQLFSDKQYDAAFRVLYPEAEAGSPVASFLVGQMFLDGLGSVRKDPNKGAAYITNSANKGYAPAIQFLARRFEVAGDFRKAIVYYGRLAGKDGNPFIDKIIELNEKAFLKEKLISNEYCDILRQAASMQKSPDEKRYGMCLFTSKIQSGDSAEGFRILKKFAANGDPASIELVMPIVVKEIKPESASGDLLYLDSIVLSLMEKKVSFGRIKELLSGISLTHEDCAIQSAETSRAVRLSVCRLAALAGDLKSVEFLAKVYVGEYSKFDIPKDSSQALIFAELLPDGEVKDNTRLAIFRSLNSPDSVDKHFELFGKLVGGLGKENLLTNLDFIISSVEGRLQRGNAVRPTFLSGRREYVVRFGDCSQRERFSKLVGRAGAQSVDNYFRDFPSEDGGITASFEFITLTGWKQAKPGNNI